MRLVVLAIWVGSNSEDRHFVLNHNSEDRDFVSNHNSEDRDFVSNHICIEVFYIYRGDLLIGY